MSSVRMCDRCGTVFSELADGWQTFSATTIQKKPGSRQRESIQQILDACPACAMQPPDEAPATAAANDTFFHTKLLESRVEELEGKLAEQAETTKGGTDAGDHESPLAETATT